MNPTSSLPLILFSGLAADAGVFAPQRLAFPQLIVPKWIAPVGDESLTSYCERFAATIRLPRPALIGGASFGGIVALEMARFLQPRGVLLIGSVRQPRELPRRVRMLRPLRGALPLLPVRTLQWLSCAATTNASQRCMPHLAGLARQFRDADPELIRWSLRKLLDWHGIPHVTCPILQIHGDGDGILPIGTMHPDSVVKGGGHVISLTHAAAVNAFLCTSLDRLAGESFSASLSSSSLR